MTPALFPLEEDGCSARRRRLPKPVSMPLNTSTSAVARSSRRNMLGHHAAVVEEMSSLLNAGRD